MSSSNSSTPSLTPTSSTVLSELAPVVRKTSIAFAEPSEGRRAQQQHNAPHIQSPTPVSPSTTSGGTASTNSGAASSAASTTFGTQPVAAGSRTEAGRNLSKDRPRSLSSPPPPPTFVKRVGFDTFDNKDASDYSLTLKSKHKDYNYTRRSRTFLCGTDQNDYSEFALEWLIDELVDDGDEIVCLRVVDKDAKVSSDSTALQERVYRQEAEKLMQEIIGKNEEDKCISIILEFAVGKVHETIQRMINMYEPVILIVGTRGRSLGGIQGLLPGSVSKYCLQHSPVPVIVVRPSNKREKKKKKRQADPARKSYMEILEKSNDPSIANIMHHGNTRNFNSPLSVSVSATPTTGSAPSPTGVVPAGSNTSLPSSSSVGGRGSVEGRDSLERAPGGSKELFGGSEGTFNAANNPLATPDSAGSGVSPGGTGDGVSPGAAGRADPLAAAGAALGS